MGKWPKKLPPLTEEQIRISNDFMEYWHTVLPTRVYSLVESFNHGYVVRHAPMRFSRTLELGAGLGEHLRYERLTSDQKQSYFALELRENMANHIRSRFSEVQVIVGDCQKQLPFEEDYFDRILAIHVLEHLPDLPSTIREVYRVCNKERGVFSVVIPCEGGVAYGLARRVSAQRLFEKRYNQDYTWLVKREHINLPYELFEEIGKHFSISHKAFFPLLVPSITFNLCIGLTLRPKK